LYYSFFKNFATIKASVISALEIEKFDIFKEQLLNLECLKSAPGALVNKTHIYIYIV